MIGKRWWGIACILSLIVIGAGCGSGSGLDEEASVETDAYVLYDPAQAEASGLSEMDLSVDLAISGALAQFASDPGNFETLTLVVQPISIVDVDPIQAPWCGHCGVQPIDPTMPVITPLTKDLTTNLTLQPIIVVIEPIIDPGELMAPWCGHCGTPVFKDIGVTPLAVRVTAMPALDDINAPWCGHCGEPFDFILTPDDISRFGGKALVSGASVIATTVTPLLSMVDVLAPWCGHCSPIDIILAPRDIFNPIVIKDVAPEAEIVDLGMVVAPLE
jgi:thiol-disulfide isomerase/thioredoxin